MSLDYWVIVLKNFTGGISTHLSQLRKPKLKSVPLISFRLHTLRPDLRQGPSSVANLGLLKSSKPADKSSLALGMPPDSKLGGCLLVFGDTWLASISNVWAKDVGQGLGATCYSSTSLLFADSPDLEKVLFDSDICTGTATLHGISWIYSRHRPDLCWLSSPPLRLKSLGAVQFCYISWEFWV